MAAGDDWGQASINNTNGFGKGAENNTISWGLIQGNSYGHPRTNLTGGGGFTGLLDTYGGANKAYSVARRLSSNHTGALIEIRVDTTGQPTYDIGFDAAGNLDVADLVSKAAGNDAFVSKRYNQAGTGLDNEQISAANQPRIATAGVVRLLNGKPALDFDTAGQYLETAASPITTGLNDGLFNIAVGATRNNTVLQFFEHMDLKSAISRISQIFLITSGGVLRTVFFEDPIKAESIDSASGVIPNNTQVIVAQSYDGVNTGRIYRNGIQVGVNNSVANQNASSAPLISGGGRDKIDNTLNGYLQESIFWITEQESNAAAIMADINSYYGAY